MLDGTLEPRSYEFVDATRQHDAPIEKRECMPMVSCIVTPQAPKQGVLRVAKAIDRGTVEPTVVVTCDNSTGRITGKECLNTASPFKKNRTRYQKFQKKISKKNRRSKRYKRAVSQMQKQMRHVKNQRTYAECIAAKQICSNTDIIIMEKLPLKKMTCRGKGKKRHMNREMRFVRHTMLEQRIKNRAELYGIPILKINPRYTSQTCSRCGHISKESRVTRDSFKCVSCDYIIHADVNAATNISRIGLRSIDIAQAAQTEEGIPFERRELDVRRRLVYECPRTER